MASESPSPFECLGDRRARKQSKDKGKKVWQPKSGPSDAHAGSKPPIEEGAKKRQRSPSDGPGDGGDGRQQPIPRKDKKQKPAAAAAVPTVETDAKAARLASYARLELRPGKVKAAEGKPKSQEKPRGAEEKPVQEGPKLSRAQKKNQRRSLKRSEKRGGGEEHPGQ